MMMEFKLKNKNKEKKKEKETLSKAARKNMFLSKQEKLRKTLSGFLSRNLTV